MSEADVRAAIDRDELRLWGLGMHSIIFISDKPGECAAVIVGTCADHAAAAAIAEAILGEALVRVDTLRFDEPTGVPAWMSSRSASAPPRPRASRRRRDPQALAA
jgi:hypothetical protein